MRRNGKTACPTEQAQNVPFFAMCIYHDDHPLDVKGNQSLPMRHDNSSSTLAKLLGVCAFHHPLDFKDISFQVWCSSVCWSQPRFPLTPAQCSGMGCIGVGTGGAALSTAIGALAAFSKSRASHTPPSVCVKTPGIRFQLSHLESNHDCLSTQIQDWPLSSLSP